MRCEGGRRVRIQNRERDERTGRITCVTYPLTNWIRDAHEASRRCVLAESSAAADDCDTTECFFSLNQIRYVSSLTAVSKVLLIHLRGLVTTDRCCKSDEMRSDAFLARERWFVSHMRRCDDKLWVSQTMFHGMEKGRGEGEGEGEKGSE